MATAKTIKSTAVAVKKPSGAVVSIQEQLRKQAADLNSRVAPASGITIGIGQDKTFKLPDGRKADTLEVVIVEFTSMNVFYEGAYDKDAISPPACFAIGYNPINLAPSANAPARQADSCKSCPMNEFGSAGKGKACKNMRVLAVLPPDADADTPLWLLKVSPTAIKNFDAYVRNVASAFQMPPVSVVTTVSFDDAVDYASVRFSDPVPNEKLETHFGRIEEAKTLLETEPDTSQYEAAKPQPAKKVANARGAMRR
jgi:hypothetical protein